MKIAIIDDQKQDRDNLREEVTAYFSGKDIPLECDLFAGGEEFLFPAEGRQYDLVFLDIFMEEPDGIQTARILTFMRLVICQSLWILPLCGGFWMTP